MTHSPDSFSACRVNCSSGLSKDIAHRFGCTGLSCILSWHLQGGGVYGPVPPVARSEPCRRHSIRPVVPPDPRVAYVPGPFWVPDGRSILSLRPRSGTHTSGTSVESPTGRSSLDL